MRIRVIAFSNNGCRTALRLGKSLPDDDVSLFCKTTHDSMGIERIGCSTGEWTRKAFAECDAIVFIGAVGIAVRYIAPHIRSKDVDPAVICMDEHGRWTIPILSGHIGGSNLLAERIASCMGSEVVITTATDMNGVFSVDTFAVRNNLHIGNVKMIKEVSARILDGKTVGFCSEIPVIGEISNGIVQSDSGDLGICISYDPSRKPFDRTLNLTPKDIVIGVGCKRGADSDDMEDLVLSNLRELGISPLRVDSVNSIMLKADETAILDLAERLKVPARFHESEELAAVQGEFSHSELVEKITGVGCVCERAAMIQGGELILDKTPRNGMTLAIARKPMMARFLI